MRRGEIWTAAGGPDYAGKPRPTLIVQTDLYRNTRSVIICGFTSNPAETDFARPPIAPSDLNGLREPSKVMIDKMTAIPRERLRERVGRLDGEAMAMVDQALHVMLGLA